MKTMRLMGLIGLMCLAGCGESEREAEERRIAAELAVLREKAGEKATARALEDNWLFMRGIHVRKLGHLEERVRGENREGERALLMEDVRELREKIRRGDEENARRNRAAGL